MQGTWKEKIGGYFKDFKRKKQKRKHTIKDKLAPLSKKFKYGHTENNILYKSTSIEFKEPEPIIKHGGLVDIYIAKLIDNGIIYKKIYFLNHKVYDNETNEIINAIQYTYQREINPFGLIIIDLVFHEKKYIHYDKSISIKKYYSKPDVTSKTFFYGKPLPEHFFKIIHNGRNRRFYQRKANRNDRSLLKIWLSKNDFDNPVKTHSTSKSIAYEVY